MTVGVKGLADPIREHRRHAGLSKETTLPEHPPLRLLAIMLEHQNLASYLLNEATTQRLAFWQLPQLDQSQY